MDWDPISTVIITEADHYAIMYVFLRIFLERIDKGGANWLRKLKISIKSKASGWQSVDPSFHIIRQMSPT